MKFSAPSSNEFNPCTKLLDWFGYIYTQSRIATSQYRPMRKVVLNGFRIPELKLVLTPMGDGVHVDYLFLYLLGQSSTNLFWEMLDCGSDTLLYWLLCVVVEISIHISNCFHFSSIKVIQHHHCLASQNTHVTVDVHLDFRASWVRFIPAPLFHLSAKKHPVTVTRDIIEILRILKM